MSISPRHAGVHPRLGALDVVPFVALDGSTRQDAVDAARAFGAWAADALAVPIFFYDDADTATRSLPATRRDAFDARTPDLGPPTPHPTLGAMAVGAREPLVAVNCELARDDVVLARAIATRSASATADFRACVRSVSTSVRWDAPRCR